MAKKNVAKGLSDFLEAEFKRLEKGVKDRATLSIIGAGVLEEVRSMVSKGISPIEGGGRFPEYKAKSQAKSLRKTASAESAGVSLLGNSKYSRRLKSQANRKSKALRKTAKQTENRGYPNSVQKKFPQKRPRPVNLFLSGTFLKELRMFLEGGDDTARLLIGFEDGSKEALMEEGHRIGWLGQGKRPIIPAGNEKFAQRIQRVVEKILGQQLAKKLRAK